MARFPESRRGCIMDWIRTRIDNFIGIFVRRRSRIIAHPTAKIRWSSLWGTRQGKVTVDNDSIINCRILFDSSDGEIKIGKRCYIGSSLLVCHSSICIEDDTIISWGVTIVDHDSHPLDWLNRSRDVVDWRKGKKCWDNVNIKAVHIEEKVWIGFGVSILKGVRIGRGAVVGACSVLTRDVPPYAVVAGNPARVVRELKPDER